MRGEFVRSLIQIAQLDSRIVLLTGDLGYGSIEDFQKTFPQRFFNLGIAEQSLLSVAAGMASQGLRPFVYSIGNFPTFRALEQLRNDVAFMKLPVTTVTSGTGFSYGTSGYTHHLIEDIAILQSLDIDIYSPGDNSHIKTFLETILSNGRSAYLRLDRQDVNSMTPVQVIDPFCKTAAAKEKIDVVLIGLGTIANVLFEVSKELNSVGYKCKVFCIGNFAHIESFAEQLSISNLPIVVVEDHILSGGLGSLFLETLTNPKQLLRLGIEKINHHVTGSREYLQRIYGLDKNSLFTSIRTFVENHPTKVSHEIAPR